MAEKRRQYRRDINVHLLSGTITKDPEFKYGKQPPHRAVLKFQIVTICPFNTKTYTWCKAFNNYAEMLSKRLVKGTWVLVRGPNYNKKMAYSGGYRNNRAILVDECVFLDGDRPSRDIDKAFELLRRENNPDLMEVPDYDLGI